MTDKEAFLNELWEDAAHGTRLESLEAAYDAGYAAAGNEPTQKPVAWRYWKDKFACWEYSDTRLESPAVPAGTKMVPLFLVRGEK